MTYIVEAFMDGHWTHLLATADHAHAVAFRREIRGVKTRLTTLETDERSPRPARLWPAGRNTEGD